MGLVGQQERDAKMEPFEICARMWEAKRRRIISGLGRWVWRQEECKEAAILQW